MISFIRKFTVFENPEKSHFGVRIKTRPFLLIFKHCDESKLGLTAIFSLLEIFWFTSGLFWMPLAVLAYVRVDKVSSKLIWAGDTVAIMEVLVRPPSESCNKRVNLDSLERQNIFYEKCFLGVNGGLRYLICVYLTNCFQYKDLHVY